MLWIVKLIGQNGSDIGVTTYIFKKVEELCAFFETEGYQEDYYYKVEKVIDGNEIVKHRNEENEAFQEWQRKKYKEKNEL